jgi:glutathionylspermidine synthase
MIDQKAAGLCFRETPGETDGLITSNASRFVPHLIPAAVPADQLLKGW